MDVFVAGKAVTVFCVVCGSYDERVERRSLFGRFDTMLLQRKILLLHYTRGVWPLREHHAVKRVEQRLTLQKEP